MDFNTAIKEDHEKFHTRIEKKTFEAHGNGPFLYIWQITNLFSHAFRYTTENDAQDPDGARAI